MKEFEGNLFCEICGAVDADVELQLCPNCLREFSDSPEEARVCAEKPENES